MSPTNTENANPVRMDEFNRLTLTILADLYESFPMFTAISPKEFYNAADGWGAAIFEGTVRFLYDEGFIKYSFEANASDGPMFMGVQLTLKGLEILKKSPDSLERQQTIIDKVKNALKTGSKKTFEEAMKLVLSEAGKSFLNS